jgi:hypothetical protein
VALAFRAENIPDELKALPYWLAWSYDPYGTPRAVCVHNGGEVSGPGTWSSFEKALAYFQKHDLDGLGFVLRKASPYVCVELTDCRSPHNGELQSWAQTILSNLNSHSEVAPSGTGVKVIVRGTWTGGQPRGDANIRILAGPRGIPLTGRRLVATPRTIENRQDELDELALTVRTDDGVINRARRARNGENFTRLFYAGDLKDYMYEQEGQLALANMLAYWLGPDATPEQLERLLARSALGRERDWLVRKVNRDATIAKALEGRGMLIRIKEENEERNVVSPTARPEGGPSSGEASEKNRPENYELFALARKLVRAGDVLSCQPAVKEYAAKAGKPFDECWLEFLVCWPKVLLPDGADPLEWALGEAEREPVELPAELMGVLATHPLLVRLVQSIAGAARHLSRLMGDKPFLLPIEKLSALLGAPNLMAVSRAITLLEIHQMVKCVRAHDYKAGRAKKYVWLPKEKP